MAELYILQPLFAGKTELEQILVQFKVLGVPNEVNWKEGYIKAAELSIVLKEG